MQIVISLKGKTIWLSLIRTPNKKQVGSQNIEGVAGVDISYDSMIREAFGDLT